MQTAHNYACAEEATAGQKISDERTNQGARARLDRDSAHKVAKKKTAQAHALELLIITNFLFGYHLFCIILTGVLVNMTIDSVFPPFAQNQNSIPNNRLVFSVAVSTSICTSIFFIFAIVCAEYAIISDEHLVPLSGTGAI